MANEKLPFYAQSLRCSYSHKAGLYLAQILKQGEKQWINYWQNNNYDLDQKSIDLLKDFTSSYVR